MKLEYKISLLFLMVIPFLGSCAGFKAVEADMKVEQLFAENKELYFIRSSFPKSGYVSGELIVLHQNKTATVVDWHKYLIIYNIKVDWKIEEGSILLFSEEYGLEDGIVVKGEINKKGDLKVKEGYYPDLIFHFHSEIPEVLVKNFIPRIFENGLRVETPEK